MKPRTDVELLREAADSFQELAELWHERREHAGLWADCRHGCAVDLINGLRRLADIKERSNGN